MATNRRWCCFLLGLLIICFGGCGSSVQPKQATESKDGLQKPMGGAGGKPANAVEEDSPVQRRIIKTTTLELVVGDFEASRKQLEELIQNSKGYVAKSELKGNAGSKRMGEWTIRVPFDAADSFVQTVAAMGQTIRHLTDAQDVTEEYLDTEAILTSLRESQTKLNQLMKDKAQSLQDFAIWEEKIGTVRREIARYDARLRNLSRLTTMSTVHVTLRDDAESVPIPKQTYSNRLSRTFWGSVNYLGEFGEELLLFLVGISVWLPIIIPAFLLGRFLLRRFQHKANELLVKYDPRHRQAP